MGLRQRYLRQRPIALLAIGLVTGVLVSTGEPASVDTGHRLQVAHSWWTDEPEVQPVDAPNLGVPGRDGALRAWYGLGQSLYLLPFDVAASKLVRMAHVPERLERRVRIGLVAVVAFSVIAGLVLLASYFALRELGFSEDVAVLGTLGLQFLTGHLAYTQINQENSQLLLLDLLALGLLARWARRGGVVNVLLAATSSGAALLIRLPAVLDAAALLLFGAAAARSVDTLGWRSRRIWSLMGVAVPILLLFVGIDRWYQWYRFGSPWTTYIHLFGERLKAADPTLAASFPFDHPFWPGFLGPLLDPQRSILLLEPMAVLAFALLLLRWRSARAPVRLAVAALAGLFVAIAAFYARYYDWPGASAWGDRFITAPIHAASLVGLAWLIDEWRTLGKGVRRASVVVAGYAAAVQWSSILFWYNLEEGQSQGGAVTVVMPWQRFLNLAAVLTHRFGDWHLTYPAFSPRAIQWNFAPFLASAYLPEHVVRALQGAWLLAWALLAGVVVLVSLDATERLRSTVD
jgi:hypothetical protein